MLELRIQSKSLTEFVELLRSVSALASNLFEPSSDAERTVPVEQGGKDTAQQPTAEAPEVPQQYEAPSASIEAVRKALVPLIEAGKQAQVQELFRRFGGEKLSDIPEDKLGELLAAAEELTT